MRRLAVELYGTRVGWLEGVDPRTADFRADPGAIETFGLASTMVSESLPLVPRPPARRAARRVNVFVELLPEGDNRAALAAMAGLRVDDSIGLLARFGRDVAGALQLWDVDDPTEPRHPSLEPVSETEIARILDDVRRAPLGNLRDLGKTSLAGVQQKIVLVRQGVRWFRPIGGYASTHIVKVAAPTTPTMLADEWLGHELARRVGLATHSADLVDIAGVPALVVERFDRHEAAPDGRLHQEDMNQALGASGNEKYQRFGGVVTLDRIDQLVQHRLGPDARVALIRRVALTVAMGDLDAHAKNMGVMHFPDGGASLAPSYDTVPLAHQRNDGEVALAVAGEYRHAAITLDMIVEQFGGTDVVRAEVVQTVERVRDAVRVIGDDDRRHPAVVPDIVQFSENLLAGRPAGLSAARGH